MQFQHLIFVFSTTDVKGQRNQVAIAEHAPVYVKRKKLYRNARKRLIVTVGHSLAASARLDSTKRLPNTTGE